MKKTVACIFALFLAFLAWQSQADVGTLRLTPVTSIQNGVALNGILNNYYTGNGGWGTFDSLWQDPAAGPHPVRAYGDILMHTGTKWSLINRSVTPGHVLQIGDDPSIIGAGVSNIFWGAQPGVSGFVTKTGSPDVNYVTYWSGSSSITGNSSIDPDFYFEPATGTLNVENLAAGVGSFVSITTDAITLNGSSGGGLEGSIYTPTRTAVANCNTTGASAHLLRYQRVGQVVTVSGICEMNVLGAPATFRLSLPFASLLANADELSGMVISADGASGGDAVKITADLANDEATISINAGGGIQSFTVQFSYLVL